MCSYWSISFAVIVVFGFILEINGDEQWWRPTRFGNSENINIRRDRRGNDHTGGLQDTYSWNNNQWTNEAQGWGRAAPSKDTNRSDDLSRTNRINRNDYGWYDDDADDYDDDGDGDGDNDDYDDDGDYDDYDGDYDDYDVMYDDDWGSNMWNNPRRVASNNDRGRGTGALNVIRWRNDMYDSDDLWD